MAGVGVQRILHVTKIDLLIRSVVDWLTDSSHPTGDMSSLTGMGLNIP